LKSEKFKNLVEFYLIYLFTLYLPISANLSYPSRADFGADAAQATDSCWLTVL